MRVGRQAAVQVLMKGLVLPVGGDDVLDHLGIFRIHFKRRRFVARQFLQGRSLIVSVQFGIQNAVARALTTATAGNELVVVNVDRHLFANVLERLGPAQHEHLPFGFLHGFGEQLCPLHVDEGLLAVKHPDHLVHARMQQFVGILLAVNLVFNDPFLSGKSITFGTCRHGCPPLAKNFSPGKFGTLQKNFSRGPPGGMFPCPQGLPPRFRGGHRRKTIPYSIWWLPGSVLRNPSVADCRASRNLPGHALPARVPYVRPGGRFCH